jgi:hypothetical protein
LSCLSAGKPLVLASKGKNAGIVLSFSGLPLSNFIVSTPHLAGRERQTQIRGRSAAERASRSDFPGMLQAGARNRVGLKLPSPAALIHRWLPICPSSSLAGNLTLSSRLAGLTNRIRGEADELSSDLAGDLIKLNASLVTFAYEQRQLPLIPAVAPSRELSADLAGYGSSAGTNLFAAASAIAGSIDLPAGERHSSAGLLFPFSG